MNRFLYSFHSWLGLIAGLGLLIIGITGSIIVFKEEIDRVITPEVINPNPEAPHLKADALLAEFHKALPNYIPLGWGSPLKPDAAVGFYAVEKGQTQGKMVYVNPATGKPTTDPETSKEPITNVILSLHYTFLADHVGEALAGIFAAMLCILGISGFWLYRGFWKTLFLLRWGRTIRIFFSDLHKMVGITSTVFNLILGFTGAWWNISHLVYHAMEGELDQEPAPYNERAWPESISIETLIAKAQEKMPGFTPNWISLPGTKEDDITFYGTFPDKGILRSDYGSRLHFNSQTGELKEDEMVDIRQAGTWDQILDSFRPLHYGSFGGLPVKILWSLGGLTPAILAISGSIMWLKRKKPSKKKKILTVQAKTPPPLPLKQRAVTKEDAALK